MVENLINYLNGKKDLRAKNRLRRHLVEDF